MQTYKPCMPSLCETRKTKEGVRNLHFCIGMKECYQVKWDEKGDGLGLYWLEGIIVELLYFSKRSTDVYISGGPSDHMWR